MNLTLPLHSNLPLIVFDFHAFHNGLRHANVHADGDGCDHGSSVHTPFRARARSHARADAHGHRHIRGTSPDAHKSFMIHSQTFLSLSDLPSPLHHNSGFWTRYFFIINLP